jgi:hypothetical protein
MSSERFCCCNKVETAYVINIYAEMEKIYVFVTFLGMLASQGNCRSNLVKSGVACDITCCVVYKQIFMLFFRVLYAQI